MEAMDTNDVRRLLGATRAKSDQLEQDVAVLFNRLSEKEKELHGLKVKESAARKEISTLSRETSLLHKHVELRSSQLQASLVKAAELDMEMKAVNTWWEKTNRGLFAKSSLPWSKYMPETNASPRLPELPSGSSTSSKSSNAPPPPPPTGPTFAFLGLSVKFSGGVVVIHGVDPNGPAAAAGIQAKDVLISLGNIPTTTTAAFRQAVKQNAVVGRQIPVVLNRGGQSSTRTVTLTIGSKARTIPNLPPMRMARDLEAILNDPKQLSAVCTGAFNACDMDCTGFISKMDFLAGMRRMLPVDVARFLSDAGMMEAFQKGDTEGAGLLVCNEFHPVMEQLFRMIIENARPPKPAPAPAPVAETPVATPQRVVAPPAPPVPWLGMVVRPDPLSRRPVVRDVVEGGPAACASLRDGDFIVSIGGKQLPHMEAFREARHEFCGEIGAHVKICFNRHGQGNQYSVLVVGKKEEGGVCRIP